ncbi:uncharacterized protein LOC142558318 [Dermacentor variabilis]|uniref:uncharacterized protein LOC142558318 n=1 Tax=Dermacentor variabilis TaxID=34621 RepID=UPI003F5CA289
MATVSFPSPLRASEPRLLWPSPAAGTQRPAPLSRTFAGIRVATLVASPAGECLPCSRAEEGHPASVDPRRDDTSSLLASRTHSADGGAQTTLDSSREPQPLLQLEAGAEPTRSRPCSKTSILQLSLIGVLFAGLVTAAVPAMVGAAGGRLAPHDLLPDQELSSRWRQPEPLYNAPPDVSDGGVLIEDPRFCDQQPRTVATAPSGDDVRDGRLNIAAGSIAWSNGAHSWALFDSPGTRRSMWTECIRHYYTYCTLRAMLFNYDTKESARVPATAASYATTAPTCSASGNRAWRAACSATVTTTFSLTMPSCSRTPGETSPPSCGSSAGARDSPDSSLAENSPWTHCGVCKTYHEFALRWEGIESGRGPRHQVFRSILEAEACRRKHLPSPFLLGAQAQGRASRAEECHPAFVGPRRDGTSSLLASRAHSANGGAQTMLDSSREHQPLLQDEDLFPGAKLTKAESLLMVMAHSLSHGCSKEATENLLQLFSAHLPKGVA